MRLSPTPRVKRPKPPPSYVPWDCVVLAIDTAERSGWAVYVRGKLVSWGEVDMLRPERGDYGWDAARVCMHAFWEVAEHGSLPVVLVYERPFAGSAQGQYQGAWKIAFCREGGNRRRMLGVYPATWRARVTGLARATRKVARDGEQRRAERETGGKPCGPDAAAAICIGTWAARAGEVGACMPKPPRAKRTAAQRPTWITQAESGLAEKSQGGGTTRKRRSAASAPA